MRRVGVPVTATVEFSSDAKYRLGAVLVQTATLRRLIAAKKWNKAYVAADLLDVLLNDPNLTAIRDPQDVTGRA
jgi:hypothetical protein